jgi:hypothetical protein
LYSLDKSQHLELQNNGDLTLPNGGTISDSAVAEGSLTFTPPTATNKWTLGLDGSTIFPNNTLKGYSFTATNTVTNYIPQAGSFLYDDSPILGLITTEGGAWYIKGPGLVGWKQITQAQDNSGVALILRIGSGNTPLPDGSEFPSGGGNVYTISQYIEFNLKVADKTWIFNKDGDLTLPASGDILDSNGTSVLGGGGQPTSHKSSHATGGSDALSPADIGAAESSHTHPLSQLEQSSATNGQVPTWSGSAWVPQSHTYFQAYEHFITNSGIGLLGLTYAGLNGGSITQVTTNPAVFGAVRMATANNTTANTGARINGSGNINNLNPTGVGEFRFVSRIMRFSTNFFSPTIRGIFRTGLGDSINAGPSNGFFFSCQETNAVNFNTVAGGVTTSTPTGFSILQNQWNLFEFTISANGASVTAKINGTTVATHTTNIPNAYMFPITNLLKYQADAGLVQLDVDYIYISLTQ